MNRLLCAALLAAVSACSAEAPAPAPTAPVVAEPPPLAQPNVVMRADPAPPFTYWAPEGAVITNHPDVPGIWFADLNGQRVASYFGDACHASELQNLVGQPVDATPAPPDANWRVSCTTCPVNADLQRDRVNVLFNEESRLIETVACY